MRRTLVFGVAAVISTVGAWSSERPAAPQRLFPARGVTAPPSPGRAELAANCIFDLNDAELLSGGPPQCGGPPYGPEYCQIEPGRLYTYEQLRANYCEVDPIPSNPCPPEGAPEGSDCDPDPRASRYMFGVPPIPEGYCPTVSELRELFAPPRCVLAAGCSASAETV